VTTQETTSGSDSDGTIERPDPTDTEPADAQPTDAQPTDTEPTDTEAAKRKWFRYTLPGLSVALIFACLSFTPSLLPRSGIIQGAVLGITAAIGYGLGVAGAWVWRMFADREPRATSRRSWLIFAVVAVVALVLSFLAGLRWQAQIRDLMDQDPPGFVSYLLLPVVAALLFTGLVALGRVLRKAYLSLSRLLIRVTSERGARLVGFIVVAVATWLVVSGVLLDGLMNAADRAFAANDLITFEGVEQPTSELRSGGPASGIEWDDLGREGRKFVATGPSIEQISDFTGESAEEPIRAFAGLAAADDAESRAQLALEDLRSMGAFDRDYLLVATTTGSGWINPSAVDSFEYMTGGNSATVGIQYSHLPSWISYLVDQEQARDAGRALFDVVYGEWSDLPPNRRPELIVFGESLGSFGGETAFSGEYDIANRTRAALFVGPPNFNTLYGSYVDDRDPGTREVDPIYKNGRIVRFTNVPEEPTPPEDQPWQEESRSIYLVHPSDPIVWWSPHLLLTRPDWLEEERGHDVLDEMVWIPFVTFWQVTADLPMATGVPPGHGHDYGGQHVYGWAEILQLEGWTDADTERLSEITRGE
jgi:uncharacterized membrane protein